MKYLVISDIHANLAALNAVLDDAAGDWRGFLCLGDLTGYGPDPEPCVRLVRSCAMGADNGIVIAGNHDAALSGALAESWFNPEARSVFGRTRAALSPESLEWLATLPATRDLGDGILVSHGSPLDPLVGYLFGGMETLDALVYLTERGYRLCFCGHTHESALYSAGLCRDLSPNETVYLREAPSIVNPGSVGFPRSLVGSTTWTERDCPAHYLIWDSVAGTIRLHEARYDRRDTTRRMGRSA